MHIKAVTRIGDIPCTIVGFVTKYDNLYVVVVYEDGSIRDFRREDIIVIEPTIAPKHYK